MYSKDEMFKELNEFLYVFAQDAELWLGRNLGELVGKPGRTISVVDVRDADLSSAPLWSEFDYLYEYGVHGQRTHGRGSPVSMDVYMAVQHNWNRLPPLVAATIFVADARSALDGDVQEYRHAEVPEGYLTLAEVAVLADLDERSVRNAASQKSLRTEQYGKRAVVPIAEARRWLSGKKGFRPTVYAAKSEAANTRLRPIEPSTARLIQELARKQGISVEEFVTRLAEAAAEVS